MILADDIWLRGKAAQSSLMQLWAYNVAFAGTATIQAWKMSLTAPAGFWQAMGRVSASDPTATGPATASETAPKTKASATLRTAGETAGSAGPSAKSATPPSAAKSRPVLVSVTPSAPEPEPEPETTAGPSPHLLDAPRGGQADDLTALKGVGAKLATSLNEFGIYHFDQLATLDEPGIDWLNEQQAGFKMLCARYDVVAQARARLS